MVKCTFLLPLHDNNGANFPQSKLSCLRQRIAVEFGGYTSAGENFGRYTMADGSEAVDWTETIIVCIEDAHKGVGKLRDMVAEFGRILGQESMYFEVSSAAVEFVSCQPKPIDWKLENWADPVTP